MAGKYHYISALAEMTAADIVKNENEWTRFLTTAATMLLPGSHWMPALPSWHLHCGNGYS